MKNFIRTANGIYEATDWLEDGSCWCMNNGGEYFPKCEIEAEANTPEELCDEIVVKENSLSKPILLDKISDFNEKGELYHVKGKYGFRGIVYTLKELMGEYKEMSIKGGIWTDDGLKYVFKMDKKGGFDLICN